MPLRIFLSYSGQHKRLAGKIKRLLEEYDQVTCFVAHDDIRSGAEWENKILEELKQSDYFMPLNTEELTLSYWCQQEAGAARALDIPIVPLIPDENGVDPVGFYARYQGIKIIVDDLRTSIKNLLLEQGIIQHDPVQEEIEVKLMLFEKSDSWAEASHNITSLLEHEDLFTNAHIMRIAQAASENDQIRSSFDTRPKLRRLFSKHARIIPKDIIEGYL